MTSIDLAKTLNTLSTSDLQKMSDDELKELKEFLVLKTSEIGWILKGRARAKRLLSFAEDKEI